jgi:hypothetical protein
VPLSAVLAGGGTSAHRVTFAIETQDGAEFAGQVRKEFTMNINGSLPAAAGVTKPATPAKASYTVASVQAMIKDATITMSDGPKNFKPSGQATKNFFRDEIGRYHGLIQDLKERTGGGLQDYTPEGGVKALIDTYQVQIDRANKALSTAPEAEGFDILF